LCPTTAYAYGRLDRTTSATSNGFRSISLVDAKTNAMQATPEFYFCNGALTISLWGRPATLTSVGTILYFKDARDFYLLFNKYYEGSLNKLSNINYVILF
jgi:hypothetical protein